MTPVCSSNGLCSLAGTLSNIVLFLSFCETTWMLHLEMVAIITERCKEPKHYKKIKKGHPCSTFKTTLHTCYLWCLPTEALHAPITLDRALGMERAQRMQLRTQGPLCCRQKVRTSRGGCENKTDGAKQPFPNDRNMWKIRPQSKRHKLMLGD